MTDSDFRAAVESADTYKAAAAAIGEPYSAVYDRARRLRAYPKNVAERRVRRAPAATPPPLDPVLRKPAPEPTPPVLSPWIPPPSREKPDVVLVRLDQAGRVRAEIDDRSDHCATWVIRDVTGAVVGKVGLCIGIHPGQARRDAEEGADTALVKLGWLPVDHVVPVEPCATAATVCARKKPEPSPDLLDALCVAFGAAAQIAVGWTEEDFVELARWCWQREQRERAA